MPSDFSQQLLAELTDVAIDEGVYERGRRRILLGAIGNSIASTLPQLDRPRDQLISDLQALAKLSSEEGWERSPLLLWLSQAQELTGSERLNGIGQKLGLPPMKRGGRRLGTSFQQHELVSIEDLPTRRELVKAALMHLAPPNESYRGTVVGPLFLHPNWYVARRNRRRSTPNFDTALAEFIARTCTEGNSNVRLIFTFSPRYEKKISEFVYAKERGKFKDALFHAVEATWGSNGERGPDICNIHPGYGHIDMIFDGAAISTYRASQQAKSRGGVMSRASSVVARERARFDEIFDESSKGQHRELAILHDQIRSLWCPG